MYFHDRAEAGDLLANQLGDYRYENTVVLALSPGGVVVGEQIARRLHATMAMLFIANITAPGDESMVLGAIDQDGHYTENNDNPDGGKNEYAEELRGYVEEEKLRKMSDMARLWGEYGEARAEQLAGRNVILVLDGVVDGAAVMGAARYLNLIDVERIIAAIPVGSFEAIEQVSKQVNELHYLYIPDTFIAVDHYYTHNPLIDRKDIAQRIDNIVARWL